MPEQNVESPVLDLLATMTAASLETSTLEPEQLMLVRIAALVAIDAPPMSYLLNLGAAGDLDIGPEEIRGVFAAIAPIVGTPRIVAAAGNVARALGIALDLEELEKEPVAKP